VLFDLDGVLVDSAAQVEQTWREWAKEHGLDPEGVARSSHGRRSADHILQVAPELDWRREAELLEQRETELAGVLRPLPGAVALYNSVPSAIRAVVTSGSQRLAIARLHGAGFAVPSVLISADDVSAGKPSPEGYEQGARGLGVDPSDCLVIEDASAGVAAGKAAGMTVLAVATTLPADALAAADATVDSLESVSIVMEGSDLVHVSLFAARGRGRRRGSRSRASR